MRSPLDTRGSLAERLTRLAVSILLIVIALSIAVSFIERVWPALLAIVVVGVLIWVAVRVFRAARDPWR